MKQLTAVLLGIVLTTLCTPAAIAATSTSSTPVEPMASIGRTLPPGGYMFPGDYLEDGDWWLIFNPTGTIIGYQKSTKMHCYEWAGPGFNSFARYESTGNFVVYTSAGEVWRVFYGSSPASNVSITHGTFRVGSTAIHGPAPACAWS
jgi:hypothetical protein